MTTQRIDVAALPALKITAETFEHLTVFGENERPVEKNGATWKVRLSREPDAPWVICRYVGLKDSAGCTIEMLRPRITTATAVPRAKWKTGTKIR